MSTFTIGTSGRTLTAVALLMICGAFLPAQPTEAVTVVRALAKIEQYYSTIEEPTLEQFMHRFGATPREARQGLTPESDLRALTSLLREAVERDDDHAISAMEAAAWNNRRADGYGNRMYVCRLLRILSVGKRTRFLSSAGKLLVNDGTHCSLKRDVFTILEALWLRGAFDGRPSEHRKLVEIVRQSGEMAVEEFVKADKARGDLRDAKISASEQVAVRAIQLLAGTSEGKSVLIGKPLDEQAGTRLLQQVVAMTDGDKRLLYLKELAALDKGGRKEYRDTLRTRISDETIAITLRLTYLEMLVKDGPLTEEEAKKLEAVLPAARKRPNGIIEYDLGSRDPRRKGQILIRHPNGRLEFPHSVGPRSTQSDSAMGERGASGNRQGPDQRPDL